MAETSKKGVKIWDFAKKLFQLSQESRKLACIWSIFGQNCPKNRPNLDFFTPNDRDFSKMGSKLGTVLKNFYNFHRSPENWGLIRPFLAGI